MIRGSLILILAASAALAQSNTHTAATATVAKARSSSIAGAKAARTISLDTPVMTIRGLCAETAQQTNVSPHSCKTVITRQEFESFVKSLSATTREVDRSDYRKAAENYFILMVYAIAGQRDGVEKDPRFDHLLAATRRRALGDMYRSQNTEKALHITDKEISAYYEKNIDGFEEVDLDRFQIAKNNPANLSDLDFRAKAEKLAQEMRARAAKGEDIVKLEKQAMEALGEKGVPNVQIGVRRGQLRDELEKQIFALRQGEITPVLDAAGLWVFFKRTSRETLTLEEVKTEIHGILYREKTEGLEKTLHDAVHVDYNEAYLSSSPDQKKNAPAKSGDPIITIQGLCDNQKPESGSCTRVVTREEFEPVLRIALLNATNPTSAIPRSIAQGYVDELIYADAAQKTGLDKDPRLPGVMELARQRALGDMYRLKQDEKAHEIPAHEIEASYKTNLPWFEELTLTHISVPRQKSAKSHDVEFEAKAKRLIDELHERALKGENMEKLQREVYATLDTSNPYASYEAEGIKTPPVSSMKPIRRGEMDQNTELELFALKPGQVSSVREFPTAYVIYKVESRRTIPLEEARAEISQKLYRQNVAKLMAPFASVRAEYNERYLPSKAQAASAQPPRATGKREN